jgi:hypothetical protein
MPSSVVGPPSAVGVTWSCSGSTGELQRSPDSKRHSQRPPDRAKSARVSSAVIVSGFAGRGVFRGFTPIPLRFARWVRSASRAVSKTSSSVAPGWPCFASSILRFRRIDTVR